MSDNFDPTSAKLESDAFDPSSAQIEPATSISPIQQAINKLKTRTTVAAEAGLGVAETIGVGTLGVAEKGLASFPAFFNTLVKSGGDAVTGKSIADRFVEEHNAAYNKIDNILDPRMSAAGKNISDATGRILDKAITGLGDLMYESANAIGLKSIAPLAGAAGQTLGTAASLGVIPGLGKITGQVPKVEAGLLGDPIAAFGEKFPRTMRLMDASHVGDAPVAAARVAEPTKHFARIVEDAVNKELTGNLTHIDDYVKSLGDTSPITLGDKIRMVVQKHSYLASEEVPIADQIQYSNAVIDRIFKLQQQADILDGARQQRLALPAPKEFGDIPQLEALNSIAVRKGYRDLDEFAKKSPQAFEKAASEWRQQQIVEDPIIVDKAGIASIQAKMKQAGAFDISDLDKNVESLKHLGEGVTKYAAIGLVRPPTDLYKTPFGKDIPEAPKEPVTMYRAQFNNQDMELKPGAWLTPNANMAKTLSETRPVVSAHKVNVSDLVEVYPDAYIYAPPGTDLGPMFKYRDASGNRILFSDFATKPRILSKFHQAGAFTMEDIKGWEGIKTRDTSSLFDIAGMKARGKARVVAAELEELNRERKLSGMPAVDSSSPELQSRLARLGIAPKNSMPTSTLMGIRGVDRAEQPKQNGRLQAIQKSIKDYGIKQPVTVTISKPDGLAYVTNGNHRVLAANNLGLDSVPVRFETSEAPFTDMQKRSAKPLKELGLSEQDIPSAVRTPEMEADVNEIRRLLGEYALGGKQRGAFDVERPELNTKALKEAAIRATPGGWNLRNPNEAANYVKQVMQGNEAAMDASRKAFGDSVLKKARRSFYAHDYDLRNDLTKAGLIGKVAHDRMVVQNGATMAAKTNMDKVNRDIFDNFNHEDRKSLDEIIRLRRIIQIDKYKGIGTVRHEGGITGPMAAARIEQIKDGFGPEKYKTMNDAATQVFEEQKILLDKLLDNGLISPELHKKLYSLDYTRTEYLDIIDPQIPISSHVKNMPTSIRSSGIGELGHGKTDAVNIDSQQLLMEDMARVENRIFKNNTLLAIRDLAQQNPDNGIVRMPGKNLIRTDAKGNQYIRQTPEGWTSIGVRVGGKQEFMLMRDEYAEQFVNRPEAMPEWLAITFRTISGTSLLKTTSTGMNPAFALAGIPMDIFHTWVTSSDVYSNHLPKYLMQIGADMSATAKDAFTKTGSWEDAMHEGIGSSYLTHESRGLTDPSKSIQGILKPKLAKVRNALSYINDTTDMWIRLAYRKRLIDSGMDSWQATATARDRLDYYQGGMVTKAFDSIIPYANVTVQATGKAIEAALNAPQSVATKAAWLVGTAAAVKLANMAASPETDKSISVMDKVRNWNITFGDQFYTVDQNGNKRYLYIPIRLDQVVMPFNAAVVGGLELANYGKVPSGITGQAIGQISPISSAIPIPTIDAISTYVSNYDAFTDRAVYQGPKVEPKDEIKTFGEGQATNPLAIAAGQATGMSPMRLQAGFSKLINTNNLYIQGMGGAYKLLFEGANPRDQAASTMVMLSQVPGLRAIVKLTTPANGIIEDLMNAEKQAGSQKINATHSLNDLIFQYEHDQNNVNLKTIETYINNQPPQDRKKLADHAKYTINVDKIMDKMKAGDNIPTRAWWIASAKADPTVRAQAFYDHWISAEPSDRQRMLQIANSLQSAGVGYMSDDFLREFAAQRKLLGDEHR